MKKLLFLAVFAQVFVAKIFAQDYLSKHFSQKDMGAQAIMWDAVEDAHGRIYFANNDGVVRYDGKNWFTFKTPNPVRHLTFDAQGDLYVACLGDFGIIEYTGEGNYSYTSIKKLLAADKQKTGGDEKVFAIGKSIYFHTTNRLVQTEKIDGKFVTTIFDLDPMNGAFTDNGKLYLNTEKLGLGYFERGKIKIIAGGELLSGKTISSYLKLKDETILCELNGQCYSLKNNRLYLSKALGMPGTIALASLPSGIAAGTMNNGVKIVDAANTMKQEIKTPSKEIYSVFVDHEGSIWTGHGNGLTQTHASLPVKQIDLGNITGTITDIALIENTLIVSTTAGVYQMDANKGEGLSKVLGITAECWDLQNRNGTLYIASTDGLYAKIGNQIKLLLPGETILHLQSGNESKQLYALGENGGWLIKEDNSVQVITDIPALANSIYEKNGSILFAGTYQDGLWAKETSTETIPKLQGGEVKLRQFDNNLYAQTKEYVYMWNLNTSAWEESKMGETLFANSVNKETFLNSDCLVLLPNGVKLIEKGETLSQSILHAIGGTPVAYIKEGKKYWLAQANQLYIVEDNLLNDKTNLININLFEFGKNKVAFAGVHLSKNGQIIEEQEIIPEISNEDLPVKIYFGIGSLLSSDQQLFSYKINGIQKDWSTWQRQGYVELQGLSGGSYTIQVKGKDATGKETEEAVFKFYIQAPWYLSGWAFLIYLILLFILVYAIIFLNQKRLITKNKQLEEKVLVRTKELFEEKAKSDELLLNILPLEVAEELKQTGKLEARQFDDITVLFTDFVGFTTISEKLTPKELVEEIHHCFKAFDEIIGANKLEKIKTIGDAYMAVCGMPLKDKEHAHRVVEAAKQINQFIAQYQIERKQSGKPYFEIRMGINSGPVIAGIVGVKKYAYDIWGDTVNTAARMEQNCEPGKINLSGSTYELIKDSIKCSYRGKIEAKNKGRIDMYYLVG